MDQDERDVSHNSLVTWICSKTRGGSLALAFRPPHHTPTRGVTHANPQCHGGEERRVNRHVRCPARVSVDRGRRARAHVVEAGDVYPDRADVVRVGVHVRGEDEPGGIRVRVRVRVRVRGRGRGRGRVRVARANCILGPSLIQMLVLRILSSSGWISVKLTWRRWGGDN